MTDQRFFAKLVCLLAVLCCCFGAAQAQQNSLGVAPASVEANVKRGSTYTQTYKLFNNTAERLHLSCSVIDYWYDQNNKRVTGRPGTLPRSASSWVQFSPSEVIVEAHSSASVKATMTIPLAASGGYYTMPVFEARPIGKEAALHHTEDGMATASISVRFRGLVTLTTEDANEYNVEIMGGQVLPPTVSTPLEMNLDVRNRSNAHVRVRGVFALLDARGKLTGRGKVDEKRYLPGQRDTFKAHWLGELMPGRYTALITLSYERTGLEPATLVYELPFVQAPAQRQDSAPTRNHATATYSDGTNTLSTIPN